MINLTFASLTFFLIHRLISGGPGRGVLVRRMGERSYRTFFSLASLLCLGWMIYAYAEAHSPGDGAPAWIHRTGAQAALAAFQLMAVMLIVPGVMTANPASVGQGSRVANADVAKGMLRITRHPFLWGLALFSATHLLVRHDPPSLLMFGTLVLVALVGTVSIDAKRRRVHGADWTRFAEQTSNIPFAAIATGRQRLRLSEIGRARAAVGLGLWAALIWAHPHLGGGGLDLWGSP
jgi:uncharacterized membrane protein